MSISSRSREIARRMLGDSSLEDRVRQRCSIAVGDFAMADLVRFHNRPIKAGLVALANGATIFTDIRMVQCGVLKKGHGSSVRCVLDHGLELARCHGMTRTSAGIISLRESLPGSVVVIGNAPSCLLSLCRLIEDGVTPALVIGCPVGFVNAAESKEALRCLNVPSITTYGTRGGTPVAVAAMNEIINIFTERRVA